ncbi:hypothetical protein CBR_g4230 [Chara braunii]|uniref:Uncharacterized protein n=1 Tax=Chara braunii TaxID=69332 RepID=A0A388JR37_CHABU|nr:hypothetical protein CBR_g4230 [Chara braunii]|eukprot:GBG60276.1 hypothetical protein CBR_g4230 [Chara braunii]
MDKGKFKAELLSAGRKKLEEFQKQKASAKQSAAGRLRSAARSVAFNAALAQHGQSNDRPRTLSPSSSCSDMSAMDSTPIESAASESASTFNVGGAAVADGGLGGGAATTGAVGSNLLPHLSEAPRGQDGSGFPVLPPTPADNEMETTSGHDSAVENSVESAVKAAEGGRGRDVGSGPSYGNASFSEEHDLGSEPAVSDLADYGQQQSNLSSSRPAMADEDEELRERGRVQENKFDVLKGDALVSSGDGHLMSAESRARADEGERTLSAPLSQQTSQISNEDRETLGVGGQVLGKEGVMDGKKEGEDANPTMKKIVPESAVVAQGSDMLEAMKEENAALRNAVKELQGRIEEVRSKREVAAWQYEARVVEVEEEDIFSASSSGQEGRILDRGGEQQQQLQLQQEGKEMKRTVQLESLLEDLRMQLKERDAEMAAFRRERDREKADLEAKVSALKSEVENLIDERAWGGEKVAELEAVIGNLRENLRAREKEMNERVDLLKDEMQRLEGERARWKEKAGELDGLVTELGWKAEEAKKEPEAEKTVAQLRMSLDAAETRVENLRVELEEALEGKQKMEERAEDLELAAQHLQFRLAQNEKEMESLRNEKREEIRRLYADLANAKEELTVMTERLKLKEREAEEREKLILEEKRKAESKAEAAYLEISRMREERNALVPQLERLQQELNDKGKQLEAQEHTRKTLNRKMKERLEEIGSERDELKQKLKEETSTSKELRESLADIEKEIASLRLQKERMGEEAKRERAILQGQVDVLSREREGVGEKIKELTLSLDAERRERELSLKRCEELELQMMAVKTMMAEKALEVEQANRDLECVRQKVLDLTLAMSEANERLTEAERAVEEERGRSEQANRRIAELLNDLDEMAQERQLLRAKVAQLEDLMVNERTRFEEASQRMVSVEKELEAVVQAREVLREKMSNVQIMTDSAHAALADREKLLEKEREMCKDLGARLELKSRGAEDLEREREVIVAEIAELRERLRGKESELEELKGNMRSQMEVLQSQLDGLRREARSQVQECETAKARAIEASALLAELKKKVSDKEREMEVMSSREEADRIEFQKRLEVAEAEVRRLQGEVETSKMTSLESETLVGRLEEELHRKIAEAKGFCDQVERAELQCAALDAEVRRLMEEGNRYRAMNMTVEEGTTIGPLEPTAHPKQMLSKSERMEKPGELTTETSPQQQQQQERKENEESHLDALQREEVVEKGKRVRELEEIVKELRGKLAAMEGDMQNYAETENKEQTAAEEKVKTLSADVARLVQETERWTAETGELKGKVRKLEEEIAEKQQRLDLIEEEKESLQCEVSELRKFTDGLEEAKRVKEEEALGLLEIVKQVRADAQVAWANVTELDARLMELEQRVEEKEKQRRDAEDEGMRLQLSLLQKKAAMEELQRETEQERSLLKEALRMASEKRMTETGCWLQQVRALSGDRKTSDIGSDGEVKPLRVLGEVTREFSEVLENGLEDAMHDGPEKMELVADGQECAAGPLSSVLWEELRGLAGFLHKQEAQGDVLRKEVHALETRLGAREKAEVVLMAEVESQSKELEKHKEELSRLRETRNVKDKEIARLGLMIEKKQVEVEYLVESIVAATEEVKELVVSVGFMRMGVLGVTEEEKLVEKDAEEEDSLLPVVERVVMAHRRELDKLRRESELYRDATSSRVKGMEEGLCEMKRELATLDETLVAKEEEIRLRFSSEESMLSHLREKEGNVERLEEELDKSVAAVRELQVLLDEERELRQNVNNMLEAQKEKTVREVENMTELLKERETELVNLHQEMAGAREALLSKTAELEEREKSKVMAEEQVEDLKKEINRLSVALRQEAEEHQMKSLRVLAEASGKIECLEGALREAETELKSVQKQSAELERQLMGEVEDRERRIEGRTAEVEALKKDLRIFKGELECMKEENEGWKEKAQNVQEECNEALGDVERLQECLGEKQRQNDELSDMLESLNAKLEEDTKAFRAEAERLKGELAQSEQKVIGVRERLSLAIKKGKEVVQQREVLKANLMERVAEVDELASAKDEERRGREAAVVALQDKNKELAKVRADMEALAEVVQRERERAGGLEGRLGVAEREKMEAQLRMAEMEERFKAVMERVEEARGDVEIRLRCLGVDLERERQRASEAMDEAERCAEEIRDLRSQVEESQAREEQLVWELEGLRERVEREEEGARHLEEELAAYRVALAGKNDQINELVDRERSGEERCRELEMEVVVARDNVDKSEEELEALKEKLSMAVRMAKKMKLLKEDAEERAKKLDDELGSLKAVASATAADFGALTEQTEKEGDVSSQQGGEGCEKGGSNTTTMMEQSSVKSGSGQGDENKDLSSQTRGSFLDASEVMALRQRIREMDLEMEAMRLNNSAGGPACRVTLAEDRKGEAGEKTTKCEVVDRESKQGDVLKDMERAMNGKEIELAKLHALLDERERELEDMRGEVEEKRRAVASLEAELERVEARVEVLGMESDCLSAFAASKEEAMDEARREMGKEMEDQVAAAMEARSVVDRLMGEVAELRGRLAGREESMVALRAELQQQLTERESEVHMERENVAELTGRLATVRERCAHLEEELVLIKEENAAEVSSKEEELRRSYERVDILAEEVERLRADLLGKEVEMGRMKERLEGDMSRRSSAVQAAEAEAAKLKEEVEKREKAVNVMREELEKGKAETMERVKEVEDVLQRREEELQAAAKRAKHLEEEIVSLEARGDQLLSELEAESGRKKMEVEVRERELGGLRRQVEILAMQLGQEQERAGIMEREVESMHKESEHDKQNMDGLQKELGRYTETIKALEGEVGRLNDMLLEKEKRVNQVEAELEGLRGDLERGKVREDELAEKLQRVRDEATKEGKEAFMREEEAERKTQELRAVQRESEELRERLAEREKLIEEKEGARLELVAQLSSLAAKTSESESTREELAKKMIYLEQQLVEDKCNKENLLSELNDKRREIQEHQERLDAVTEQLLQLQVERWTREEEVKEQLENQNKWAQEEVRKVELRLQGSEEDRRRLNEEAKRRSEAGGMVQERGMAISEEIRQRLLQAQTEGVEMEKLQQQCADQARQLDTLRDKLQKAVKKGKAIDQARAHLEKETREKDTEIGILHRRVQEMEKMVNELDAVKNMVKEQDVIIKSMAEEKKKVEADDVAARRWGDERAGECEEVKGARDALESECKELKRIRESLEKRLEEVQRVETENADHLAKLREELISAGHRLVALKREKTQLQKLVDQGGREMDRLKGEFEKTEREKNTLDEKVRRARDALVSAREEVQRLSNEVERLEGEVAEREVRLERQMETVWQLECQALRVTKLELALENAQNEMAKERSALEDAKAKEESCVHELTEAKNEAEKLSEQVDELVGKIEELTEVATLREREIEVQKRDAMQREEDASKLKSQLQVLERVAGDLREAMSLKEQELQRVRRESIGMLNDSEDVIREAEERGSALQQEIDQLKRSVAMREEGMVYTVVYALVDGGCTLLVCPWHLKRHL